MTEQDVENELLDYEEDDVGDLSGEDILAIKKERVKGSYVSIHSSGFRDFLLKPELLRAIVVSVLVMCHTRELAFQISKEYERFSKYMATIKVAVFFGGLSIKKDGEVLKKECPHVMTLNLRHIKHFILDGCDKMLEQLDMRRDVQEIFRLTPPHEKQVMMFSATLSKEIRPVCRKFMQDVITPPPASTTPLLIFGPPPIPLFCPAWWNGGKRGEEELPPRPPESDRRETATSFYTIKGIVQRCVGSGPAVVEQNFPAVAIHRGMPQEERLKTSRDVSWWPPTCLAEGIDIERVNIAFNYDMPEDSDTYLHRVARAGRFGTKGVAITFVSDETDARTLNDVQERFEVNISELPDEIDISSYIEPTR
ncbi:unnamed protein product [Coregonus sp. 'balchen']|nr:unnamed protein product [Coregonus sp. 'balchen']